MGGVCRARPVTVCSYDNTEGRRSGHSRNRVLRLLEPQPRTFSTCISLTLPGTGRRVEQERIPLHVATERLASHGETFATIAMSPAI
jgi:hypothetical protein